MTFIYRGKNIPSQCGQQQKVIVSKEKYSKHIAKNDQENDVSQYRVDGVIIDDTTKRCDYLLLNHTKQAAYYIELKGSNLKHALEQLLQTDTTLREPLSEYVQKHFRVVLSRTNTHKIKSSHVQELERKLLAKGSYQHKSRQLEERI